MHLSSLERNLRRKSSLSMSFVFRAMSRIWVRCWKLRLFSGTSSTFLSCPLSLLGRTATCTLYLFRCCPLMQKVHIMMEQRYCSRSHCSLPPTFDLTAGSRLPRAACKYCTRRHFRLTGSFSIPILMLAATINVTRPAAKFRCVAAKAQPSCAGHLRELSEVIQFSFFLQIAREFLFCRINNSPRGRRPLPNPFVFD